MTDITGQVTSVVVPATCEPDWCDVISGQVPLPQTSWCGVLRRYLAAITGELSAFWQDGMYPNR